MNPSLGRGKLDSIIKLNCISPKCRLDDCSNTGKSSFRKPYLSLYLYLEILWHHNLIINGIVVIFSTFSFLLQVRSCITRITSSCTVHFVRAIPRHKRWFSQVRTFIGRLVNFAWADCGLWLAAGCLWILVKLLVALNIIKLMLYRQVVLKPCYFKFWDIFVLSLMRVL